MRTKFRSENVKGRDLSEDLSVDGRILKLMLREQGGRV
jgi:hypothetical protein